MLKKDKRKKQYKAVKKEYFKKQLKDIFFHEHSSSNLNVDEDIVKKIPQLNADIIIHKIALISNGKVADVISCPENLANILTGNVKILKVPYDMDVKPGWFFINDTFEKPEDFKPYISKKENE